MCRPAAKAKWASDVSAGRPQGCVLSPLLFCPLRNKFVINLKYYSGFWICWRRCIRRWVVASSLDVSPPSAYLGVAIERFLQLKVFPRLAGQIHPLAFEPPNGGFLQQGLGVDFSHKSDVFAWTRREQWLLLKSSSVKTFLRSVRVELTSYKMCEHSLKWLSSRVLMAHQQSPLRSEVSQ